MKNYFIKLFIILGLTIFLFSCSKDTDEPIQQENLDNTEIQKRTIHPDCDYCNCLYIRDQHLIAQNNCVVWGGHFCDLVEQLQAEWDYCISRSPICPPKFVFDGCNCSSQVGVPEGYHPFIFRFNNDWQGLYVRPNCNISTANDCCPDGYTFDGANCKKEGIAIPPGYPHGFIYNNVYYSKPNCGE